MLELTTFMIIYVLMWLGLVAAYTLGGFIELLTGEGRCAIHLETISEK